MRGTLVDSNVLLDMFTEDDEWFDWSTAMLARAAERGHLVINPIIYAEVAPQFDSLEELDEALPTDYYRRANLPWEAGFLDHVACFWGWSRLLAWRVHNLDHVEIQRGWLSFRTWGVRNLDQVA